MIHTKYSTRKQVDITLFGMVKTSDGNHELADSEPGREATSWDVLVQYSEGDDRDPILEFEGFETAEQADGIIEILNRFFPSSNFDYI